MKNKEKPLSYFTNRLSIGMIFIFFPISYRVVFIYDDHRERIISLAIALSTSIISLIVTIASPNRKVEWLSKILNRKK